MAKKSENTNISEGFIRLPRSLLESEKWNSLRFRQQKLFLYILLKTQYTPYIYKHNGKDIQLLPGDLCVSLRRLVDDFNDHVKFKDEKIDVPFLQRAVSTFSKMALTDTRTDTGITIIRVIYPGIYESNNSMTDTAPDTETIQKRYSHLKEEGKKEKKEPTNLILPSQTYEDGQGRSVGSSKSEKLKEWLLKTEFRERGKPDENFSREEVNDLMEKYPEERIIEVINMIGRKTPKSREGIKSEKAYLKMALYRGWK